MLKGRGYDAGKIDGVYGSPEADVHKTWDAVNAFKKKCGLPQNGIVDEPTYKKLFYR